MSDYTDESETAEAAATPVAMAYWMGWNPVSIPDLYFRLGLSFGQLGINDSGYFTDYMASGDFPTYGTAAYLVWNPWLLAHGNGSVQGAITVLSYGGGSDTNIRPEIFNGTPDSLSRLAGEMKGTVAAHYFGGLDIDAEGWWNATQQQNTQFATNLATVVSMLRTEPNGMPLWKPLTVSVGATAAGAVTGVAASPAYDGTMRSFFADTAAMGVISGVNVMAYNLTDSNLYADLAFIGTILAQFVTAGVPAAKLFLGIQPVQNAYGPGSPLPPVDPATVQALGAYLLENGYGGAFLWGIGDSNMPASPTAAEYMTALMTGLGLPTNSAPPGDVGDANVEAEPEDSFE